MSEFRPGAGWVAWPAGEPQGFGVFDGPLCLGLFSDSGDVTLPWKVRTDESGRPVRNDRGEVLAVDPTGQVLTPLRPIGDKWLTQDAKNPLRVRVLFAEDSTQRKPATNPSNP